MDFWIFAYGSLMWRPGFAYEERSRARLVGAHRALCLYSMVHRGTPSAPGLVLGLDKGGACDGIAFRVAKQRAEETRHYLRRRENSRNAYAAVKKPVTLLDGSGRTVLALCFFVDRRHRQYAGALTLERQADLVRRSIGASGANLDYVVSTVAHLRELEIFEPRLEQLLARLGRGGVKVTRRAVARLNADCPAAYISPPIPAPSEGTMLEGTPREKIVAAALQLAEKQGWRGLSLGEIAAEAGMPLADLRKEFQSKGQILAAFSRELDRAVIEKFPRPGKDAPRDRLFDVLLTRFEVMQPYKSAIRRIQQDIAGSPSEMLAQMRPALKSQYWMLAAAGISGEGGAGLLRVQGLLGIYRRVFGVWLDDDDPGLARTMAVLDRSLRRGESLIRGLERIREGVANIGRSLRRGRNEEIDSHPSVNGAASPQQDI